MGLGQYAKDTSPTEVGALKLYDHPETQRILRMLVQAPYSRGLKLPVGLEWIWPALSMAERFQRDEVGVLHPHTYITVRRGPVVTKTDDVWHVDGFSTRYAHLPEANYIMVSGSMGTEYLDQTFEFPEHFDPLKHDIQKYFQNEAAPWGSTRGMKLDTLYFLDPYVIHRRPPSSRGAQRTFVRISFTPIEIPDINNTPNPLLPTAHYVLDGIKEFRDGLRDYHEEL